MSDSATAPSPPSPAVRPSTPTTTAYSHTGSQTSGSTLAANGLSNGEHVNGGAESLKMATTA